MCRRMYELMVPFQTDRPRDSAMIGAGPSTDLGDGSVSATIFTNGSGSSPVVCFLETLR